MEPLIQNVVGDVMAAITERLGKPIDALHWFRVTALDISGTSSLCDFSLLFLLMNPLAGEVLLGKSFGAIKSGGDGPEYVHHLDNAFLVWALYGLSPGFSKFLSLLPFKGLQEFMAAGEYVYKVSSARLVLRAYPDLPLSVRR
jgi:hypothetical protein